MAEEMIDNLDKIASVLGLLLTKDMNTTETVAILHACGFGAKDISHLTGSSENSVYAMLSNARKKTSEKATPKKKPETSTGG